MRSDSTVMHSENIGPVVGEFYGTEIREVNLIDVELREISDAPGNGECGDAVLNQSRVARMARSAELS